MRRSPLLVVLVLVIVVIAVGLAVAWRPSIAAIDPPARNAFVETEIARGEKLAALGNCASCHTVAQGLSYAGGVPVATPFGTIYGTNVTPDADTGIGRWSEDAFRRAMREGIARDGQHLYPAFPYNHFTRLTDADIAALYAYLMTRDPVRAPPPRNDLVFPFGFRPLLAGWNMLYLAKRDPAVAQANAQSDIGGYFVDALAHCGACHTPRNRLGAEIAGTQFNGGESAGWYAPALNRYSPSPQPWTAEELTTYLRTGLVSEHAIAGGPMQDVVDSLEKADEADVRAIAVFIESTLGQSDSVREARANATRALAERGELPAPGSNDPVMTLGASVYAGACASCHDVGRTVSSAGAMRLPLAIAVHNPDPRNLIRIVIDGITPVEGDPGRWMPAFGAALTDEQVAALAIYLRQVAANAPPWENVIADVKKARNR